MQVIKLIQSEKFKNFIVMLTRIQKLSQPTKSCFYIIDMPKSKQIILVTVFVALTLSKITQIHSYSYEKELQCLSQSGYLDQTFVQAWYQFKTDKLAFTSDPALVTKVTGTKPFIILRMMQLQYDNAPALEALRYAKMLQNLPIKMIWIGNEIKKMNCSYYSNFASTLRRNINVSVGIADYSSNWKYNFEDINACQKQFIQYPLYFNLVSNIDQKFESFGSWTSCDMKIIFDSGKQKCGSYILEVSMCDRRIETY